MITKQQHLKNIESNKENLKRINKQLNSNDDLNKTDLDLKTQYKTGLINLEEYKQKIKEGCLRMNKEFKKTGFISKMVFLK